MRSHIDFLTSISAMHRSDCRSCTAEKVCGAHWLALRVQRLRSPLLHRSRSLWFRRAGIALRTVAPAATTCGALAAVETTFGFGVAPASVPPAAAGCSLSFDPNRLPNKLPIPPELPVGPAEATWTDERCPPAGFDSLEARLMMLAVVVSAGSPGELTWAGMANRRPDVPARAAVGF